MKAKNLMFSAILLALSLILSSTNLSAQTVFSYTGGPQYYTVPTGVTSISVCVTGGAGADATYGGYGTLITGSIPVTEGDVLEINVGGAAVDTIAGWNGGGAGQTAVPAANGSGGGGGASDIRLPPYSLSDRVVVAGGGGGMGGGYTLQEGGDALCPDGEAGEDGFGPAGTGATTTDPGLGGVPWGAGIAGMDGALGLGGDGGKDSCNNNAPGGGGGGGYYGGGGGATDCFAGTTASGGGGGGGSSLIPVGGTCTEFVGTGDGEITLDCSAGGASIEAAKQEKVLVFMHESSAWMITDGKFDFQILDLNGRLITEGSAHDKTHASLLNNARGVYVVHIKSEKGEWRRKVAY